MKRTLFFLLLILNFIGLSCEKKKDTFVRVYVTDSSGNSVPDANVRLYGQPSDTVYVSEVSLYDLEEVTDSDGKAVFSFSEFYQSGPDGFAILKAEVTSTLGTGSGLVKLIESETSDISITVE
jgi:hypothetical protein